MKVTDFLAQKQEMLRTAPAGCDLQPYHYFELRGLLACNRDPDILRVITRQALRRKAVAVLDALAAHIRALQAPRDDRDTLDRIDETERRYTQAKDRLDQEKLRMPASPRTRSQAQLFLRRRRPFRAPRQKSKAPGPTRTAAPSSAARQPQLQPPGQPRPRPSNHKGREPGPG